MLPANHFGDAQPEMAIGDDHYMQWTNACKGVGKATSDFDYSGPLTETVLLGTIAIRFQNQKLELDSAGLQFRNEDAANRFVHYRFREGWEVDGLNRV